MDRLAMLLEEYYVRKIVLNYSLLYSKICKPVSHDDFKMAMLKSLELINEMQLENWVMDFTSSNITLEDQRWAVETFGQFVLNSPLKSIAMVRREDMFLEMAAENMRDKIYELYGHHQDMEHFDNIADALKWLSPGLTPDMVIPS